jgi:hypothetical protein
VTLSRADWPAPDSFARAARFQAQFIHSARFRALAGQLLARAGEPEDGGPR